MVKQPHLTVFSWYKQTKRNQPSDLRLFGRFNKHSLMRHGAKVYSTFLWCYIRNLDQPFLQKETIHYTKEDIGGNFLQVCRGKTGGLQGMEGEGCLMEGWVGMSGIQSSSGQWRKCFPVFFPSCSCEENSRIKFFRCNTRGWKCSLRYRAVESIFTLNCKYRTRSIVLFQACKLSDRIEHKRKCEICT